MTSGSALKRYLFDRSREAARATFKISRYLK